MLKKYMLYSMMLYCACIISEEAPIHRLIKQNKITLEDLKDLLLNQSETINQQDTDGNTILHLLAGTPSTKHADMTNFMLKQEGIDKSIKNYNNKTPLQVAQEYIVEPSYYNLAYWESKGVDFDRWGASMSFKEYKKMRDQSKKREEGQRRAKQKIVNLLLD